MNKSIHRAQRAACSTDLLAADKAALQQVLPALGFSPGQAPYVLRALHRLLPSAQPGAAIAPALSLPGLNHKLAALLVDALQKNWPTLISDQSSDDGSRKWLLQFAQGVRVETVYIPAARRGTLCLSSQAGCSTRCRFCHTGTLGLQRNLQAWEIVLQLLYARSALTRSLGRDPISNVVMMGMGEPMLNWDAVARALSCIAAGLGIEKSSRRLSVSTVGVLPQLLQFEKVLGCNLVISLHAADDALRNQLVPLNQKYPLAQLHSALHSMIQPGRDFTFAYLLLDEVNDREADADQLIAWLQGLPARVNLLSLNPWPGCPYRPSSEQKMQHFHRRLLAAGINTRSRRSRGQDIAAACGQLAKKTARRTKTTANNI